jgi:hypothetical protein
MSGIGYDIAQVTQEVGTKITILRPTGNLFEYMTYELNESSSRPFTREHQLKASLVYNTQVISGDIIFFEGNYYIVANKTPDIFEGEVVEFAAMVLKCNFPLTSHILSYSQVQDPVTYEITQGWTVKVAAPYGMVFQSSSTALSNTGETTGRDLAYKLDCCVPLSYNVVEEDRIHLTATEFYRVQSIDRYTYPGLSVLNLVDDERPAYLL